MTLQRLDDRVAELKKNKHLLGDSDEAFAHNLIQYFETHNSLSEKQVYWIDKLLVRCNTAGDREEKRVEEVFDGTKLRDLFIKAASNLKFPALKIKLPEDSRINIHFYRASSLSKTPSFILITNGKHWPERSLYGSINLKGEGQITKALRPEIKTIIRKIAHFMLAVFQSATRIQFHISTDYRSELLVITMRIALVVHLQISHCVRD